MRMQETGEFIELNCEQPRPAYQYSPGSHQTQPSIARRLHLGMKGLMDLEGLPEGGSDGIRTVERLVGPSRVAQELVMRAETCFQLLM
jgi:hypothetical protein